MTVHQDFKETGVPWLGAIPLSWNVKSLKRVVRLASGATPSSSEPAFWDGDIPWLTPTDLGNDGDPVLMTSGRAISKAGYQSCGTTLVPTGSVILSTRAPIGSLGIAGTPLCFNQGCRALIPGEDVSTRYLYYSLSALRPVLEVSGEGTTFKELSSSTLADFKMCFPPKQEQEKIASYLDAEAKRIDELIAIKMREIELLVELRASTITDAILGRIDVSASVQTKEETEAL